jgi:hypothetical protein
LNDQLPRWPVPSGGGVAGPTGLRFFDVYGMSILASEAAGLTYLGPGVVPVDENGRSYFWTGAGYKVPGDVAWQFAASDESTALTSGANKVRLRAPFAFALTGVRASLDVAQTSGNIFTVDINKAGATMLSTALTIDNGEKTSTTAATPAVVIAGTQIADDDEIEVDIDQVGASANAAGLKITLLGYR